MLTAVFIISLINECNGCQGGPVQPKAISYSTQGVRTFDMYDEWHDVPQHCSHPHPAFPVEATSSGGDEVVVGFVTALAPPQTVPPPCQDALIRSYRGYVLFDLSNPQVQANLYAGQATLEFDLASSLAPGDPPNLDTCVASLGMVIDAWTPAPGNFEMRHSQPGSSFWRTASTPTPLNFIPSVGVGITSKTVGAITFNSAGHFTINVDPFVRIWLANSTANRGVALTSVYETFQPAPPTVTNSCTARYHNFVLKVYTY